MMMEIKIPWLIQIVFDVIVAGLIYLQF